MPGGSEKTLDQAGNCSLARACLTNETPESSGVVSVAGQFPRQNRGCVSGPWKEAPCPVDSEWWVGSHGVSRAAGDMVGKCRKRERGRVPEPVSWPRAASPS